MLRFVLIQIFGDLSRYISRPTVIILFLIFVVCYFTCPFGLFSSSSPDPSPPPSASSSSSSFYQRETLRRSRIKVREDVISRHREREKEAAKEAEEAYQRKKEAEKAREKAFDNDDYVEDDDEDDDDDIDIQEEDLKVKHELVTGTKRYKLYERKNMMFKQADAFCKKMDGQLARTDTLAEMTRVVGLVNKAQMLSDDLWISVERKQWKPYSLKEKPSPPGINKEALSSMGAMMMGGGMQDMCPALSSSTRALNPVMCMKELPFVCEFDLAPKPKPPPMMTTTTRKPSTKKKDQKKKTKSKSKAKSKSKPTPKPKPKSTTRKPTTAKPRVVPMVTPDPNKNSPEVGKRLPKSRQFPNLKSSHPVRDPPEFVNKMVKL